MINIIRKIYVKKSFYLDRFKVMLHIYNGLLTVKTPTSCFNNRLHFFTKVFQRMFENSTEKADKSVF